MLRVSAFVASRSNTSILARGIRDVTGLFQRRFMLDSHASASYFCGLYRNFCTQSDTRRFLKSLLLEPALAPGNPQFREQFDCPKSAWACKATRLLAFRAKKPRASFRSILDYGGRQRNGRGTGNSRRGALCRYAAAGCLVDGNPACGPASRNLWYLCNLARVRRRLLRLGTLSFPLLLAAHRSAAPLLASLSRASDPGVSLGISHHLLLLPQGLLSGLFHGSARLRRRRTQTLVLRRNEVPLHSPKSASLLLVRGLRHSRISLV